MSWLRIDDQIAFHPKTVKAQNEAFGAWVRMAAHACAYGQSGFIDGDVALSIAGGKKAVVARLVAVGYLDPADDGYQVHDFLDWNPAAEEVAAARARLSETRREAGRRGGKKSAEVRQTQASTSFTTGERRRARADVALALKRGDLKRSPCEVCGDERVEAHHADYAKPLEVQWLCKQHHDQTHGLLGSKADASLKQSGQFAEAKAKQNEAPSPSPSQREIPLGSPGEQNEASDRATPDSQIPAALAESVAVEAAKRKPAGAFGMEVDAWARGVARATGAPFMRPTGPESSKVIAAIDALCGPTDDRCVVGEAKGFEYGSTKPMQPNGFRFFDWVRGGCRTAPAWKAPEPLPAKTAARKPPVLPRGDAPPPPHGPPTLADDLPPALAAGGRS